MENRVILKKLNRLFVLIIIFLVNCNDNVNIVQKQDANSKPLSYSGINFDSIYQIKYDSSIEEWINYFELNEFIKQLNTDDFSSLIYNKKFLLRFFKGIKFSIPDEINKPEIKSRLTVIETDFMRFESMLSNYEIDKEIKIKMVKKINNSFSNLNFQIDKLLEKQEINLD